MKPREDEGGCWAPDDDGSPEANAKYRQGKSKSSTSGSVNAVLWVLFGLCAIAIGLAALS